MAIVRSGCGRFAKTQFRCAAGGVYIEQEELGWVREQLKACESGLLGEPTKVWIKSYESAPVKPSIGIVMAFAKV